MKSPNTPDKCGGISLRLTLGIALVLIPLALLAQQQGPAWWTTRGVLNQNAPAGANDYAAFNQGQLKNIATAALAEMDANLPVDSGDALHQMVTGWATPGSQTNDYAAVNLGQLKTVALPFYSRLIAAGCKNQYPWVGSPNPANDYAMANIGQVKNLFCFDLTTYNVPADPTTIPDWWKNHFFPNGTQLTSGSLAPSGALVNGVPITLLQAYQLGINPIDYYNGLLPTISIVSGGDQCAPPGVSLTALAVSVNNDAQNAPLTFTVTYGGARISGTNNDPNPLTTLQVRTGIGTQATAQIYIYFPNTPVTPSTIQVTAVSGTSSVLVTTTAITEGVKAIPTSLTTAALSWALPPATPAQPTTVEASIDGGVTWLVLGVAAPGVTSATVTGMTPYQPVQFAVFAGGTAANYTNPPLFSMTGTSPGPTPPNPVPPPVTPGNVPPVVCYPAIDVSNGNTDVPATIVLDDNNNVASLYSDGQYQSAAAFSGTAQAWSNGNTTTNCVLASDSNPFIWGIAISADGTIYGTMGIQLGFADSNGFVDTDPGLDPSDEYFAVKYVNGSVYALGPAWQQFPSPQPVPLASATISIEPGPPPSLYSQGCIGGCTPSGNYWGTCSMGTWTTGSQDLDALQGPGHYPNPVFGYYPPKTGLTNYVFIGNTNFTVGENVPLPGQMNDKNAGIATDPTGADCFWKAGSLTPIGGTAITINNNNQVLGCDNSGVNGFIWQNGNHTSLSDLIPADYQGQISDISPRLLSNSDSNHTIHILFDALFTDPTGQASGTYTYVLSGSDSLAPSTFTIYEVMLPDGQPTSNIQCINANGFLATINSGASSNSSSMVSNARTANAQTANTASQSSAPTTPATPTAGLEPTVKVSTYAVGYPDKKPGWEKSTNTLWCDDFETKAVVSGSPTSVQVLQDYKGTITVGYADGSSTCCQQNNFLADLDITSGSAVTPNVSSTDSQGTVTCKLNDQPKITITSGAMKVITSIQRSGTARDFVIVQYGNGSPTVVAESDWSFTSQVPFTSGSAPYNSTPGTATITPTPADGKTQSGGKPSQPHLVWPRLAESCGNAFVNNPVNWVVSGTGQDAINYRMH